MVDHFLQPQQSCVLSKNKLLKCSMGGRRIKALDKIPKMRQMLDISSLPMAYLFPAILLNPTVVLHFINTTISRFQGSSCGRSSSPNPFIESLGPVPGSTLYFDMHANDRLCWKYTALMVLVQLLVIWKVHENSAKRRECEIRLQEQRAKEEGKKGVPTEFDMELIVNGQHVKGETFVKRAGKIFRVRDDATRAEKGEKTPETIKEEMT